MLKKSFTLFPLVLFLAFTGCFLKKEKEIQQAEPIKTETEETVQKEEKYVPEKKDMKTSNSYTYNLENLDSIIAKDRVEAHEKYLKDPMVFVDHSAEFQLSDEIAVVGNKNTMFYPEAVMNNAEDLDKLPEGITLPFAEILEIQNRYDNPDRQYNGLYYFDSYYNYFYETEWEGQKGLVFGADLVINDKEINIINSQLYKENGKLTQFHPFTGSEWLRQDIVQDMEKNKVVFQEVSSSEYDLDISNPDDMIALYKKEYSWYSSKFESATPLFITTDLISNCMHLFFDHYLQYIEEETFIPRLNTLVTEYLSELEKKRKEINPEIYPDDHPYTQTVQNAISYFQIAEGLLKLAPSKEMIEQEWGGPDQLEYVDKDTLEILSSYSENIQNEIQLILHAEKYTKSPNFGYNEDYTQFKPRGHYTKNGVLESYFRTMMWFGRLHIYMSTNETEVLTEENTETTDNALNQSLAQMPIAVLISDITKNNNKLFNLWKELYDPITALIGISDDLSFYDIQPFIDSREIENFPDFTADMEQKYEFLKAAQKELKSPLIAGNSAFFAPAGKDLSPPMGWRLFGQRFTYDSFIHRLVSPPEYMPRDFVSGLDIMAVFGSQTADELLRQSEYGEMEGLEELIHKIREDVAEIPDSFWDKSYYSRTLSLIRSQAQFEQGSGFYFTETPAWGIKAMLSSHGTWAALRHDTLLYIKQNYAERAGDGDYEPTYRTEPIPKPIHYIEPNVAFFKEALNIMEDIGSFTRKYDLSDSEYKVIIKKWIILLKHMTYITILEFEDKPISEEDNEWIRTLSNELAFMVLGPNINEYNNTADDDQFKGAIIADIFTNPEKGAVLETGIGIPYRIYVPLNDNQGGKRIAMGYTFSYYEFKQPMSNRLDDDQWKDWIYNHKNMEEYKPFWTRGIILDQK